MNNAAESAMQRALHELAHAAHAIAEKHKVCLPCLVEAFWDVSEDAIDRGVLTHTATIVTTSDGTPR